MSLGNAKGWTFAQFCRAVKTITFVLIVGDQRMEAPLPLQAFNVPIYAYSVAVQKFAP